jgi:hypothetical protein
LNPVLVPLLLAAATQPLSCGPSPQEVGQQVLIVAPVVFLLSLGVQWILLRVWQRRWPDLVLRWRRNLSVAAALLVPAGLSLVLAERTVELPIAVWLFGCSYGAVLLLATRFMISVDRRRAFTLSHLLPIALFLAPAAVLALGLANGVGKTAENLYILPGFGGWTTGGLFVAMMIEALVRTRRAVRNRTDPPPPR